MGEGELKQDIAIFFKENALWIAIALAAIILIGLIIFLLLNKKRNPKKEILATSSNEWLNALGSKDNIIEVSAKGSRLTVKLQDPSKLNEELVKSLGVTNILKMSNKITLVLEDTAEKILEKIK